jgi:hypothetical protein
MYLAYMYMYTYTLWADQGQIWREHLRRYSVQVRQAHSFAELTCAPWPCICLALVCLGVSWCVLVCLGCSRVRRCMSSHARTPCVRVHTCARGVLYARTQARCSSTEHAAHAHTHTGKRCTRRTCCWISGKRLTRQASKAARHIPMSVFFPRSE